MTLREINARVGLFWRDRYYNPFFVCKIAQDYKGYYIASNWRNYVNQSN